MTQFKVGDWVIVNDGGIYDHYVYQIRKIIPESESFFEKCDLKGFKKYVRPEYLLPWQPKENDPIVHNKHYGVMIEFWKNTDSQIASLYHGNIEPFIGELQSFLKEK